MTLSNYIDLLRGRGRSDRTIQVYVGYVRRLMGWCAEHGHDPATVRPHDVRTWADQELPLSWSSRKAARTALAVYWGGRHDQPHEAIRLPAKPKMRYRGLSVDEARQLVDAAEMHGSRPGLATLLAVFTGARAGEIAQMSHDGVDKQRGVISWWRPKTQDHHMLPLAPRLAKALPDGTGRMFTGDGGRAYVTSATVNEWVHRVSRLAGLDVTPQQIRATAGMLVVTATDDLQAAAEVLGHSDLQTTARHYAAHVSEERVGRAMRGFAALD